MPNESPLHAGQSADTQPSAPDVGPGYEARDTNIRAVLTFVVGLVVCLVAVHFGLYALLKGISHQREPRRDAPSTAARVSGANASAEAPASLHDQLRKLRADEDATLNTPARPSDLKQGIVRIPIRQAIDLLAERGVPAAHGKARTEVDVNSHSGGGTGGGKDRENAKGKAQETNKDRAEPDGGPKR